MPLPAPSGPVLTVDYPNPQWSLRIAVSSGCARIQGHALPRRGLRAIKTGAQGGPRHPLLLSLMFSEDRKCRVTFQRGVCVCVCIKCVKIPSVPLVLIYHCPSSSDFKRTKALSSVKSKDSFGNCQVTSVKQV